MQIDTSVISPNYASRGAYRIAMVVVHATAGRLESDLKELTDPTKAKSTHYLIDKDGHIYQLVHDQYSAWHAGVCEWQGQTKINEQSIGIELVNLNNGKDPYPKAQVDALDWLTSQLILKYQILPINLVRHLDVAMPRGRKDDPRGFDWAGFKARMYPSVPDPLPAETGQLLGPATGTLAETMAYLAPRAAQEYGDADIKLICTTYRDIGSSVGLDWFLALAQLAHETANLTSFWSARPQRNPAGIGVTGMSQVSRPNPIAGWAYNPTRKLYLAGISFPSWVSDAIPAHLGRLLAYAVPAGQGTMAQKAMIEKALSYRTLPMVMRGSARTVHELGAAKNPTGEGWADPGTTYGVQILAIAKAMRGAA